MSIRILDVTSRRLRRAFALLPRKLYASDPHWVPPLWADELRSYSPAKNPLLGPEDALLTLAHDGNRFVGRNLVYVDRTFNEFNGTRTGFFGAFESTKDPAVAAGLLGRAEEWLRSRGMDRVRGPIHPVAECWGFFADGRREPPIFMAPHNPLYYNNFAADMGYQRAKDLLAYEANRDGTYEIPDRIRRFTESILRRRPSLSMRPIDPHNLARDAEHIRRISNESYSGNWGYVPVDREVMLDMVRRLRPVMDPDAIWFVEDSGRPVGYCLGFPDLNVVLKRIGGRLFPIGFFHILRDTKRVTDFRLFGLAVLPKYHNLGLDVLLYRKLFDALKPRGVRLEANYILEDNLRIRNALEKLGMEHVKTYRVYEKDL